MGAFRSLVIVSRPTRLEGLRQRWGTPGQASFRIARAHAQERELRLQAGVAAAADSEPDAQAAFSAYQDEDATYRNALGSLQRQLDKLLPVDVIDRSFLSNYDFRWCAAVVVVGQDGLVANTAKYVGDLPILGVNPDPARIDGILLPFKPRQVLRAVQQVLSGRFRSRDVTLAEVTLNDGQRMLAFNDFFIGAASHVSARYTLEAGGRSEPQSSSGILVSTGAGSTGWLSSVYNMMRGVCRFVGEEAVAQPQFRWEDRRLIWTVREPFVSRQSGADLVAGWLEEGEELVVESLMPENGVIFSDGVESDFLSFTSGTIARVRVSPQRARLVVDK